MPWIIGIDEAGYGPNLGPLVMTAVACRVPEALVHESLWRVLRKSVRRRLWKADDRLLIEDSKLVYSPARGLCDLETSVIAALSAWRMLAGLSAAGLLDQLCPLYHPQLRQEPWYQGDGILPLVADVGKIISASERFRACCVKNQISWTVVRCVLICPQRFNEMVDRWQSKGAVLAEGLKELVCHCCDSCAEEEPRFFFIDKHGGRNNYAAILQHAFPEGVVVAREENCEQSVYQIFGGKQETTITIQPRADLHYFCVALASMVSKYVREVLMIEFNRFWQKQVPGLKATAGYPTDSRRFFGEIRLAVERMGMEVATVWRQR
jgi:ribonuclease HII